MNIIQKLIDLGGTFTKEPHVFASRGKVHGRMWDGSADIVLNGETFRFELWHHGSDNETLESLISHFSLKGIVSERVGYDAGWHVIVTEKGILFYNKEGWFRNQDVNPHVNNNFPERISEDQINKFLAKGFQWFLEF